MSESTKKYERCGVSEYPTLFTGYYKNYEVPDAVLVRLSKDLGFSYELYNKILSVNKESASTMVISAAEQRAINSIVLLLDDSTSTVLGYSLEAERLPLLNEEFVQKVKSLSETATEVVKISEIYHHSLDTVSSVLLKKLDPIIVTEKYTNKPDVTTEYYIGILLSNDETSAVSARLAVYLEDQPLYLPASCYSTTTTRYKRSTPSSMESLEVLVLKVIEDLRGDDLKNKIYDLHYRYRAGKSVLATYEEYNTVLRTMRKIPTIIEDNSYLESLISKYENFERKYVNVEDQKSSYIWRCTAIGDMTVGALVSITSDILNEVKAPSLEYYAIRELLGVYISTNRIVEEIAKEDSH